MMSNFLRRTVSSASSPRPISVTLYPSICSTLAQLSRSVRSSSTTRTRMLALTSLGMERGSRALLSDADGGFRSVWTKGLAILLTPRRDRGGAVGLTQARPGLSQVQQRDRTGIRDYEVSRRDNRSNV